MIEFRETSLAFRRWGKVTMKKVGLKELAARRLRKGPDPELAQLRERILARLNLDACSEIKPMAPAWEEPFWAVRRSLFAKLDKACAEQKDQLPACALPDYEGLT